MSHTDPTPAERRFLTEPPRTLARIATRGHQVNGSAAYSMQLTYDTTGRVTGRTEVVVKLAVDVTAHKVRTNEIECKLNAVQRAQAVVGRWLFMILSVFSAFGPALASGFWGTQAIYWLGPIIGALVAGLVYEYLLADQKEPSVEAKGGKRKNA